MRPGGTIARDNPTEDTRIPVSAKPEARWSAIVLAGSRTERDELAECFGVPIKALVQIAGEPMIGHVVRTLMASPSIGQILIVAQEPGQLDTEELGWIADSPQVSTAISRNGIADSVAYYAGTKEAPWPVMITTADHPLLSVDMVEHFLRASRDSDASLAVVERSVLLGSYPLSRRTWLKFKGGAYTGANLFTVGTPKAADGLRILASSEADRKSQLKLLWRFGPLLAIGTLIRALSLQQAMARGGRRLGLKAAAIELPFAEAGIDVDRVNDHRVVSQIFADRAEAAPPEPVRVSIFDLDRTITRRGTYTAFLLHAARRHAPARLLLAPLAGLMFLVHGFGGCSRTRLKEWLHALFLGPTTERRDVTALAEEFARRLGSGGFHADAIGQMERERAEGRRIVLATAANAFYVEAIAKALGIEKIVSTQSVWREDRLLARIDGENCHGEHKLRMVAESLERGGLDRPALHVRVFTDHHSDVPLLRWADEGFIVNPSGRFRTFAGQAGWPVLDWA